MELTELDQDLGRFIAAAAGGFVKAEGLETTGNRKEDQGGRGEHTDIEVQQANRFQEPVRRGHISFYRKNLYTTRMV